MSDMIRINTNTNTLVKEEKPLTIKEYKDVVETLHKIVSGATGGSEKKSKESSPMFNALQPPMTKKQEQIEDDSEELSITDL